MYLYRYVDNRLSYESRIKEEIYEVIKETPKSYLIRKMDAHSLNRRIMISTISYPKKWIRKNTRRKFAFETKEEAMRHYRFKKRAQVRILESQLLKAKRRLEAAQNRDPSYNPDEFYFSKPLFELIKQENVYNTWVPPHIRNNGFLKEEDVLLED